MLIELYNEDLEPSFVEELANTAGYFRNGSAVKSSSSRKDPTSMAFLYLIRQLKYSHMLSSPAANICY